jgi:mannose-6-phosphate isomerase-like protein (cupin superfamily)
MNQKATANEKGWAFVHSRAEDAKWTPGLREIFDYRDLGIKAATKGDYVAHLIRHNGKKVPDQVQEWHVHDCNFQFVLVLNGWATFEYEGQGVKTIRKGDCIHQTPGIRHREIACSEDFEVLEIVSPADFKTRVVEAPGSAG